MKFEELEKKMESYRWIRAIADEYRQAIQMIEAEKEYFRVEEILYSARSDTRQLHINCHRTIPYTFIRDGLNAAYANVLIELGELEEQLKEWL